jgi:hypothetical protein
MGKYGTLALAALLCAAPLSAQVVRLEIVSREPINTAQPAGAAGPFELIRGRVHGEVDPKDPHNAIIQISAWRRGTRAAASIRRDLRPGQARRSGEGLARARLSSGQSRERAGDGERRGDIVLVSGWQGDVIPTATNQSLAVPVARKKDRSSSASYSSPVSSIFPTALTAPRSASPRSARHSRTCPPISHSPTRR